MNERDELLALLLAEDGHAGALDTAPLIPRRSTSDAPQSFAQQRLWVLDRVEGQSAAYNVGLCVRFDVSVERLADALYTIVARHEPLRTTFTESLQIVHPAAPVELHRIDDAEAFGLRPFDLAKEWPMRAGLLGGDTLVLVFHHIAVDRWSFDVLLRELHLLLDGEPLPALPIRYGDFAAWQRAKPIEEELAYWQQRLDGAPALLNLPTDRPRRPARKADGAVQSFGIDADVTAALTEVAAANGATLFMTLLAAFDVLLSRWSGDTDITVGCPVANRDAAQTTDLIGFFVNTIVLRADLSDDPPFAALLQRSRDRWIRDLEHQQAPFEAVVERLRPERSLGHNPLFQVMFQFEQPLSGNASRLELPVAIFDLTLELQERDGGLHGRLEYRTDLFERETARRLCAQYARLLRAVVGTPAARISALPLWDTGDPSSACGTFSPRGGEKAETGDTLVTLFDRMANERPDAPALFHGDRTVTYRQLARRSNALAHWLQNLTTDAPIAVMLPRSPELVIALLGVLKSGRAYVPLDPDHPEERRAYLLADSQAALVLTALEEDVADTAPQAFVTGDSAAYVMYTSGSTGAPKGVIGTHGAAVNRLRWMYEAFPFEPGDVCCQKTTITFVDSVWEIFGPLLAGVPSVIFDSATASDPARLARAIADRQVTRLVLVPSLLRELLDAGPSLLRSLKMIVSSGEALPVEIAGRCKELLPSCALLNLYGSTEVAADVTAHVVTPADDATIPIGQPIDHVELHILDAHLRPVAPGVPGELYVAGANNARGYWRRPALTAERWIAGPHGTRLFRTGDLARIRHDGTFELRGRADRQLKINGIRIEPAEIQSALAAFPGVRGSAIVPRAQHLVAYVAGDALDPADLRAFLRKRLPSAMIPSTFVILEELPLNTSGKIDLRALPAPPTDATPTRALTPTEELIAAIWCEILGIESVAPNANFFQLGGHSLAAIRAMAKTSEAFDRELPVSLLFESATLEEVALRCANRTNRTDRTYTTYRSYASYASYSAPASAAHRRTWFLQRLEQDATVDNLVLACRLRGPLDADALDGAITKIVERHAALRTRLAERDGDLVQVIADPSEFRVQRRTSIDVDEEARRPFDLETDLPTRATIAQLGEHDHLLLISLHHAASDGWSGAIFTRELNALYRGATDLPLPSLTYADYAHWQHEQSDSDAMLRKLDAWRDELADAPLLLDVPTDHPRGAVPSWRVAREPIAIDAELLERLHALARQSNATLFMTLLSAFGALLARYSGRDELLVGTPIAARPHPALHDLAGCFADMIPVRVELQDERTFRGLVRNVRRRLLSAFERQYVPFERIVDAVHPPRGVRTPLFQHFFVLRDVRPWIPDLPGIAVERIDIGSSATRFDLTMVLDESDGGVSGYLEYAAELFEPITIRRMIAAFDLLLRGVAAEPDVPVEQIALTQPLALCPEGRGDWGWGGIHTLIARHAGDTIAVDAGHTRLTYADLDRRANRFARSLIARGITPGDRVAVCLERSPELVIATLAIWKCGAAVLTIDPAHPEARRQALVEDAGARIVVDNVDADAFDDAPISLGPATVAAIVYTSGSTGRPKGVLITHHALGEVAQSLAHELSLEPGARLLQICALGFDVALGEIAMTLAAGATLCAATREALLPGPRLQQTLRDTRATHLVSVPANLTETPSEGLPDLRVLTIGGEVCPPAVAHEWSRGRRFFNAYGPTEATVTSTLDEAGGGTNIIGRPIASARVYVLDRRLRPAPIGVEGDLYIAGPVVAEGYAGRPAETAHRFVAAIDGADGERMYRTGDRARFRYDGRLEFLGRADRQLKIRGFRIEPGEIEAALAAQPDVARALVGTRPDANGDAMLVAWLLPRENATLDIATLRDTCRTALPAHMVPSELVPIDHVPLTHHGKIDWDALTTPRNPEEPPRNSEELSPMQRVVADIWRDVLRREHIGLDDNFFDAGGHSLLLARVHTALEARIGRGVTLIDLFRFPTIRTLADSIEVPRVPRSSSEFLGEESTPRNSEEPRHSEELATAPIAIIGMACRYPGAPDVDAFWRLLESGTDAISTFTEEELLAQGLDAELVRRPEYVRANGVVADVDRFDAAFFGFSPREAEVLDPQQRVFLECAWHALEDAGYAPRGAGDVGVFAGSGMNTYLRANVFPDGMPRDAGAAYQAAIGNDKDFLPTLVSYKLDLRGPSMAVQTACSTSLAAVDLACQSLQAGRCRMALAGGVSIFFPQSSGYLYEPGMILSPDGKCRAFDADARGTVRSGGAGVVVLKPLSAALAEGDRVLAVIRGSASNNDGSAKVGFTAPSVEGQAKAIATALERAGVDSTSIDYVEAHGTATELGDPVEVTALSQVFTADRETPCLLGAVKSNIGHADTAAGVAGLIKTVLSLQHEAVPPTVHFTKANPHIDFASSAFEVSARLTPWPRRDRPRRAGVSSFGIGGTNVHVVVEEAPLLPPREAHGGQAFLFPLSARTPEGLRVMIDALCERLEAAPELDPRDVAFTLREGRAVFEHRAAVVASSVAEVIAKFRAGEFAGDVDVPAPRGRRVALPGYPFERTRHFLESGSCGYRTPKRANPDEWFYLPSWAQAPLPHAGTLDGTWLVSGDDELARELAARGARIASSLAEHPTRIVYRGGLHPLLDLAKVLASTTDPVRLDVITIGAADVTGSETLHPDAAAVLGAVKVIPLEQPNVRCRAIDIAPDQRLESLIAELQSESNDLVTALRGRHRWTPRYEPVRLTQQTERLRHGGVYLITGGLGAAGLAIAKELDTNFAAKLVLVSRNARNVDGLGTDVLVCAADVSDERAMARVIDDAHARFGRIHGVIHAAGVVDFAGVIAKRTRAQTEEVMAAKVEGARILEKLLGDEAELFVFFSTLGSILYHSKFGQVGYAAANEVLDLYAAAMRDRGRHAITINWDDWAGAGMSEEAARRRGMSGVDPSTALTPEEGAAAFRRAVQSPYPRLAVSVRPLEELMRNDHRAAEEFLENTHPAVQERPADESFVAPSTPSEVTVAAIWRNCLGIDTIGAEDDFFDLGGHSLLATQVLAEVRRRFGVTLPMDTIFDDSTVRALAGRIDLACGTGMREIEL